MNEIGSSRVFWFVCGCIITAVVLGMYTVTLSRQLHAAQNTSQQNMQQQMRTVSAQLAEASQQRDACQDKFSRKTVLYEPSVILGVPEREWVIPADVQPEYVGTSRRGGQFSHYDPKTQVETVRFQAQGQ
jgi:hypothetical protein